MVHPQSGEVIPAPFRFSAFAPREACLEARERISKIDIFKGQ